MNNENDAQEIELNIDAAKATIDRMKVFLRLVENKDFQEIIEKGYFEDEAVRLVGALASPAMADEFNQEQMHKDISAIGRLRQYFYAIMQQGRAAEGAVKADEAELELMRAEGLAE